MDAKTTKVNELIPIIYLCYAGENQDLLGVSLIRKGCDPLSGVGIIKWRENVLLAANTMSHECGHLTGLQLVVFLIQDLHTYELVHFISFLSLP